MPMKKSWRDAILDNIPHGETSFLNLDKENAMKLCDILLQKGYAVCLTGGDIGDDIRVAWLYAGNSGSLDYPDYNNVVFTSINYIEEYPDALRDLIAEEESEFNND